MKQRIGSKLRIPVIASAAVAAALAVATPPQAAGVLTAESSATRPPVSQPDANGLRLIVAPTGNEARYRVREQLARLDFPNDAVGVTQAISGVIVIAADGAIVRDASRFTVDLTTLQSDSDRRDNYIRRNTLRTGQNPHAVFVPIALEGVALPLPAPDAFELRLRGELTINGVTRPVVWHASARADGSGYRGSAWTEFTFGDFDMTIPRVAAVISVRDQIRLEYDFQLMSADPEADR